MFEFVEEALDGVALLVQIMTEGWWLEAVRHGAYISPCPAFDEPFAKCIRVIGPVRQENVASLYGFEHVPGTAAIMSLALRQLQGDGQTHGIDKGVDLGRQAAPRATHATGSEGFFLPFAPC